MGKIKQRRDGFGKSMPPELPHVKIYFVQKGVAEQVAEDFFQLQQQSKWRTAKGVPVANWKALANEWIWNYRQQKRRERGL